MKKIHLSLPPTTTSAPNISPAIREKLSTLSKIPDSASPELKALLEKINEELCDALNYELHPGNVLHLSLENNAICLFPCNYDRITQMITDKKPHPLTGGQLIASSLPESIWSSIRFVFTPPLLSKLESIPGLDLKAATEKAKTFFVPGISPPQWISLYDREMLNLLAVYFFAAAANESIYPAAKKENLNEIAKELQAKIVGNVPKVFCAL